MKKQDVVNKKESWYVIIQTLVPRAGWTPLQKRILNHFEENPKALPFIHMQRRHGKTTLILVLTVALAFTNEDTKITIFVTTLREQKLVKTKLDSMIKLVANNLNIIAPFSQCNEETIVLRTTKSKIGVLPSALQTTRGLASDFVFLDEYCAMDISFFYKGLVPLLQMQHTRIYFFATPMMDNNRIAWDDLFEIKDRQTDSPWFQIWDFTNQTNAGAAATCTALVIRRLVHKDVANDFGQVIYNTWREDCWKF